MLWLPTVHIVMIHNINDTIQQRIYVVNNSILKHEFIEVTGGVTNDQTYAIRYLYRWNLIK